MGLSGLPDTDGREIDTPRLLNCDNPNKKTLKTLVSQYGAAAGATDYGAVTVWKDDNGWFQCSIQRHMITHERWKANSFEAIYPCYKRACKLIQKP